ncbi:MAG: PKD domain-containing protein [Conexivisphaerales archaeon]
MAKNLKNITVFVLMIVLALSALLGGVSVLRAQGGSTAMIVSPEMLTFPVGANFTVTVNVTNVQRLYTWQVVLKYNGSVISCTDVWIPTENVFKGKIYTVVDHLFDKDYVDGYDFMMYAASLVGSDYVDVENGILFKANFTVIDVGSTRITFATREHPARRDYLTSFDSYILNDDLEEIFPAITNYCTIIVEGSSVNLPPIARLTVYVPEVDTSRYVVLRGYAPVGTIPYCFAYKGFPVIFNASASVDDGEIILYIWDFGDGNITRTTEPVVVHIYNSTGKHTVTLTVIDNGDPPLNSTYRYIVVVGLLLERFDWSPFIYGLAMVFAALIVLQSVRKIYKRLKMRGGARLRLARSS